MPSLKARLIRLVLDLRRPFFNKRASPDEFRAMIRRQERMFRPPNQVAFRTATVGGANGEWIEPPGAPENRVLLYLHGGAWVLGWNAMHRRLVGHLALASGCRTFAVDYRVAPEHPFPAALDDCVSAYRGLLTDGTLPGNIVIAGDSAGGTLTLTTLLMLRDAGDPLPAAAVCLSPATDLEGMGETFRSARDPVLDPEFVLRMRRLYIGEQDPRSPLISPLHGDLRGLPPLLIHAGGDELLLSDAEQLAGKAEAAGVPVELFVWAGMWHVWHLLIPTLPEACEAVAEVGAFVRRCLALGSA